MQLAAEDEEGLPVHEELGGRALPDEPGDARPGLGGGKMAARIPEKGSRMKRVPVSILLAVDAARAGTEVAGVAPPGRRRGTSTPGGGDAT